MKIKLRKLLEVDLEEYKYWRLPIHKYHEYNGPYFKKATKEEVEIEIERLAKILKNVNKNPVPKKMIISNEQNELIGEVSWHWKREETNWMEIGLAIFNNEYWGKGIGSQALKLWINKIFDTRKELVRLGLSTWSGNERMIKLAEKLGMKKEAEYRKANIVNGKYYDSVSYGLLREEWESAS